MKILITGANGQMGNEFRILAPHYPLWEFLFTDIDELDISDDEAVNAFLHEQRPAVIINAAAYTAVDKAEEEPEKAMLINGIAPGILAEGCSRIDAHMVHISTDYIFSGKNYKPYSEEDKADPISSYGKSKHAGEIAIGKAARSAWIIRTSWLYSTSGHNFVKTILRLLKERDQLNVVCDQVGSPTYARDLCRAILEILPAYAGAGGIETYHYSNEGVASWYDFALAISELSGLPCKINPVTTSEFPKPASRPYYSVMSKSKIRATFGIGIPDWRRSLEECIALLTKLKKDEQP
jgi:dTDP-4-dehydrorhamnose reductase